MPPFLKMSKTRYDCVFVRDDGKYVVRVTARTGDGKAKQRTRVLPGGTTIEEAIRVASMMREHIREEARLSLVGQTMTPMPHLSDTGPDLSVKVEDYARRWFAIKKKRLKEGTIARYEDILNRWILPRVGHVPVLDVRRSFVESWVGWAENQKKPSGDSFSQDTIKGWWRVFSQLIRDLAAEYGMVDPTVRIRPPESDEGEHRESGTLTEDQISKLLTTVGIYAPDRYAEIATVALTGMRPGEVYALDWDCVDFEREAIIIRRTISGGKLSNSTKTKKPREVPMHPFLVDVLREHRQRLIRDQHPGLGSNLVFPANHGGLRLPQSTTKVYDLAREAMGLEMRLGHQVLRRTFNTLALRTNIDRINIRSMMGHSSEKMTERYAGVPLEDKRAAVVSMFKDIGAGGSRKDS